MATVPINRPIYDFADTVSYVQAVYVSGARFLLAIRQALGDQAFFAFLQDYYYQYRGRLATQAEFLALLRAHAGPAPDKLLSAYFDPAP
jgi:aminopeptidase N